MVVFLPQVKSVEKLEPYDWVHVLPGHGRPGQIDQAEKHHHIQMLAQREASRGFQTLDNDHKGVMSTADWL